MNDLPNDMNFSLLNQPSATAQPERSSEVVPAPEPLPPEPLPPEPPEEPAPIPVKPVTVTVPEWFFIFLSLIKCAAKISQSKVVESYVAQQLSPDPNTPAKLDFVHEENRSFTIQLPLELYKMVYENAYRERVREGEYVKRLLLKHVPDREQQLMKQLLAALQQRPTPDLNPEEESSSELGVPPREVAAPFVADNTDANPSGAEPKGYLTGH